MLLSTTIACYTVKEMFSRMAKKLNKEVKIGKMIIRYNRAIENHIAKHNVKISEIVRCLDTDYLIRKIRGKDWMIITQCPDSGRFLTIFLEQLRKLEFRLKTARDSTPAEKRLYRKLVK